MDEPFLGWEGLGEGYFPNDLLQDVDGGGGGVVVYIFTWERDPSDLRT